MRWHLLEDHHCIHPGSESWMPRGFYLTHHWSVQPLPFVNNSKNHAIKIWFNPLTDWQCYRVSWRHFSGMVATLQPHSVYCVVLCCCEETKWPKQDKEHTPCLHMWICPIHLPWWFLKKWGLGFRCEVSILTVILKQSKTHNQKTDDNPASVALNLFCRFFCRGAGQSVNTISFHFGLSADTHYEVSPGSRKVYAASWLALCWAPSLRCHEWGNPERTNSNE